MKQRSILNNAGMNFSTSTDPVALMQTDGTVAGAALGISLVMIILGLIGKKV